MKKLLGPNKLPLVFTPLGGYTAGWCIWSWPVLSFWGPGLGLGSCERRGSVFREKLDEYKLDIPDNKHEFLCVILDPTSEFNSNDEL